MLLFLCVVVIFAKIKQSRMSRAKDSGTKSTKNKVPPAQVIMSTTKAQQKKPTGNEIVSLFQKIISSTNNCLLSRLGDQFKPHFGMTIQEATNMTISGFVNTNNNVFGTRKVESSVYVYLKPTAASLPTNAPILNKNVLVTKPPTTQQTTHTNVVPSTEQIDLFFKQIIGTGRRLLSVLSDQFLKKFGKRFDAVTKVKIRKYLQKNKGYKVEAEGSDIIVSLQPVTPTVVHTNKTGTTTHPTQKQKTTTTGPRIAKLTLKTPTSQEIVQFFEKSIGTNVIEIKVLLKQFHIEFGGNFKRVVGTKVVKFLENNSQTFHVDHRPPYVFVSLKTVSHVKQPSQEPTVTKSHVATTTQPKLAPTSSQPKHRTPNHLPPTEMGERFVIIPIINNSKPIETHIKSQPKTNFFHVMFYCDFVRVVVTKLFCWICSIDYS